MPHLSFASPFGPLTLFEEDHSLIVLEWGQAPIDGVTPLLLEARAQLEAYFSGRLTVFQLPLRPHGSPFQQAVWKHISAIPYASTATYGDLARLLGSAPRPIGTACGRNPLPILIPCHRVVGRDGRLGGYSGADGLETKRALLRLEGASIPQLLRNPS